jgi:hypothetical protein
VFRLETPDLLGLPKEKREGDNTPYNLKNLLGSDAWEEDEGQGGQNIDGVGFRPLKFPSPSPSSPRLTKARWGLL